MKSFKKISVLVALIGVTFLIGLTSCKKDNPVDPTYDETFNYVSYGTQIEDIQVSDMTLDNDMQLLNEMQPQMVEKGQLFGGKMPMFQFREIFKFLNLTEEQRAAIKEIMLKHIECERAARLAFYEVVSGIIEGANAERRQIMADLKSKLIDRKQAGQLLRELNARTREAIAATGAVKDLRIALKGCTDEMIAAIKAQLNAEQLAKFEKWLKRKTCDPKDPGTGTGTRP